MTKRAITFFLLAAILVVGLSLVYGALTQRPKGAAIVKSQPGDSELPPDDAKPSAVPIPEEIKQFPEGSYLGEEIPEHPHRPAARTLQLRLTSPHKSSDGTWDLGIELTNVSNQPILLLYTYWPHQHLSLQIRDERGSLIAETDFGQLMSVLSKPNALWLGPGESYRKGLPLLGPAKANLVPGTYQVEGLFRYRNLVIHSDAIELRI